MADLFLEKNFKALSGIRSTCITIYIPTYESGKEVNENMSLISFKNEVQKQKNWLEENGFDNIQIEKLLGPAFLLIDDIAFWKNQSLGLAVFIAEGFFQYFKLPIKFNSFSVTSSRFILTPAIPAISMADQFYILSLNKNEFKLFSCNKSNILEVKIGEEMRRKAEEALIPNNYLNDFHEPVIENRETQVLQRTREKGNVNLPAYLNAIDEIVFNKLKDFNYPLLVLAGLKEWLGDYRKLSKYRNIYQYEFGHNAQVIPERELHENAIEILKPFLEKPVQDTLTRYQALAGSGMTSYNLKDIINEIENGRVDTLIVSSDSYLWGTYDKDKTEMVLAKEPLLDNYCLINDAVVSTINKNGRVILLNRNDMPETSSLIAIYRY